MRTDPIIKALLKHGRPFEVLANGEILVKPAKLDQPELILVQGGLSWNPSPEQIEVASWFNRRPTTVWSPQEQRKWKEVAASFKFEGDEWEALRWYYAKSGCPYLRKDLVTLLNNWNGEVDRALQYDPGKK